MRARHKRGEGPGELSGGAVAHHVRARRVSPLHPSQPHDSLPRLLRARVRLEHAVERDGIGREAQLCHLPQQRDGLRGLRRLGVAVDARRIGDDRRGHARFSHRLEPLLRDLGQPGSGVGGDDFVVAQRVRLDTRLLHALQPADRLRRRCAACRVHEGSEGDRVGLQAEGAHPLQQRLGRTVVTCGRQVRGAPIGVVG